MVRNLTSNDGERTVVLGDKVKTVSAPITVSADITGYGDRPNSKSFAEIELQGVALVLQDE